ncbi:CPBP family intramembrane metalloprotease domain-containing protein [Nocardioides gansuensis]|uniref:CPBP family intramembrane metalloprotease domain-containing protein n=1 Tax=Nocardioides gansuensis TaxID=2138300 RepID=A0A2T8F717_9ACTN|nr:CPBP family intramembrane metalloprotease domain-containing protein [Nocardioides gansuensis]
MLGFLTLGVAPLFWQAAYAFYLAATGQPVLDGLDRILDLSRPTPASLALLNLVLASSIPAAWLVNRWLHGIPPRWLSSVRPRIRWRFFVRCIGLSVVALVATVIVSTLLPQQGGTELASEPNEFTRTIRDFLLVVVLLTPLQAAGEEYAFRGYLTQAFGGLTRSRIVAVLVPAVLFALAHGAQDPPIFVDRLAFGIVAGVLVIRTGGLEAGIAMHVLNNFLAFGLALTFTDMGSALNPTGGSWWSIPATLTQSLVYLWLATRAADRMGLSATTSGAVLEPPRPRV